MLKLSFGWGWLMLNDKWLWLWPGQLSTELLMQMLYLYWQGNISDKRNDIWQFTTQHMGTQASTFCPIVFRHGILCESAGVVRGQCITDCGRIFGNY